MENDDLLTRRQSEFEDFYKSVLGALVEFIEIIGIEPSHEVLNHAPLYVKNLGLAIDNMVIDSKDGHIWLFGRMGYFIGEYFAQKFNGCWFVEDDEESRFYTRYVVGRFTNEAHENVVIDPFQLARQYVDTECPRNLIQLLDETEAELVK